MASKKKKPVVAKKKPAAARKPALKKKPVVVPKPASYDFSGPHPQFTAFTKQFKPGRYADGLLLVTPPGALDAELAPWLVNRMSGRVSLGRTAFGEFLVFRDLRERALLNGDAEPEVACDFVVVDIHTKQMKVLAHSLEALVGFIDDASWQTDFLRKALYDQVKSKLGACADDECYGFVPALVLGGAEAPGFVARQKWREHQAMLLQT